MTRWIFSCLRAGAAALVLAGCAHVSTARARPVKVLMPEINGHFSRLKGAASQPTLPAVPKRHIESLLALFEELKSSPTALYTDDLAAWRRSCDESISALRAMKQSWDAGDAAAVRGSLQVLMSARDDAHNAFSGHRAR